MGLDATVDGGTWMIEDSHPNSAQSRVIVAAAVVRPSLSTVPVRLINAYSEPAILFAWKEVAYMEPVGTINLVNQPSPSLDRPTEQKLAVLWELAAQTDSTLDPRQRDVFYNLLVSYADVFAESSTDLGHTHRLDHAIDTGSAIPTRQSVRSIPPPRRKEVQQLLQSMLQNGVIEPSKSLTHCPGY